MAIKGLTDRAARWPTLGTLRKGKPKPATGNRPGADLGETFRFDGIDAATQEHWRRTFGGDEVAELEILLPYQDLAACWEAWREEWSGGGLVRRCDGETITTHRLESGAYSREPVPCPIAEDGACSCGTKPTGRLTFTVPAFARMGSVTLTTTSVHDIIAIDGTLKALAALVGDLRRVPLRLSRVEREISRPTGDGGRARGTKWLVSLEASPEWVAMQLDHQAAVALGAGSVALPAPDDDDEPAEYLDVATGEIMPAAAPAVGVQTIEGGEDAVELQTIAEDSVACVLVLADLDDIAEHAPDGPERVAGLAVAFDAAIAAAETEADIAEIRKRFKRLGAELGGAKDSIGKSAAAAAARIRAAT